MRKLFQLLGLIGIARAAFATDVYFPFVDLVQQPSATKSVYFYPYYISSTAPGGIVQGSRIARTTGTNGSITLSNMVSGSWRVEFNGNAGITTNYFTIPDTNGLQNATNFISNANVLANSSVPAYSQGQSDLYFWKKSVLRQGTNIFFRTNSGAVYIDGLAGTNGARGADGTATNAIANSDGKGTNTALHGITVVSNITFDLEPRRNIVMGTNFNVSSATNSIAIAQDGQGASLFGLNAIQIGGGGQAAQGCIAIGSGAGAGQTDGSAQQCVAIGQQTDAFGNYGISIGGSLGNNGTYNIIIGHDITVDWTNCISIGSGEPTGNNQVIIGSPLPRTTSVLLRGTLTSLDGSAKNAIAARTLVDSTGTNNAIDWDGRIAYDASGHLSVDWGSRQLDNSSDAIVLDWENRQLQGTWSIGSTLDVTGTNLTVAGTILPHFGQMFFTNAQTGAPKNLFNAITNYGLTTVNGFIANRVLGRLTNSVAGFYKIHYSFEVAADPTTTDKNYFGVFTNGVEVLGMRTVHRLASTDQPLASELDGEYNATQILYLPGNCWTELRWKGDDGSLSPVITGGRLIIGSP